MTKESLLEALKKRFHQNMHRHEGVSFDNFISKLSPNQLDIILNMETTDGEPDLVLIEGKWLVIDMFKESPKARCNMCYDAKARLSRKKFPPETSALEHVSEIGAQLLDESLYIKLQEVESLDLKTSVWLLTDAKLRSLGGALFGDKRYQRTFIYHNGADSYYGVRGFRSYIQL
jgi:hypothetical protein